MKRFVALLALTAVCTGLAFAQAAPPATAAPATKTEKIAPVKMRELTGIVTAVDVVGNTITVVKAKTEVTFGVMPETKIQLRKEYKLSEVPRGSKVLVKYQEDAGKKTAISILIQKLGKPVKTAK